jgi:hypothetical protein
VSARKNSNDKMLGANTNGTVLAGCIVARNVLCLYQSI